MNLPVIALSKIDGGYLISCGDSVAVRQSWDDLSFLIRKWLDDPPQAKHKETLADILGYKVQDNAADEKDVMAWVDEELKKN